MGLFRDDGLIVFNKINNRYLVRWYLINQNTSTKLHLIRVIIKLTLFKKLSPPTTSKNINKKRKLSGLTDLIIRTFQQTLQKCSLNLLISIFHTAIGYTRYLTLIQEKLATVA